MAHEEVAAVQGQINDIMKLNIYGGCWHHKASSTKSSILVGLVNNPEANPQLVLNIHRKETGAVLSEIFSLKFSKACFTEFELVHRGNTSRARAMSRSSWL